MTKLTEAQLVATIIRNSVAGNPASIVAAADALGYQQWFMAVGDVKGALIDKALRDHRPKAMAELGGYIGYSAVRFGALLKELHGSNARYFSFEPNPEYARLMRELVSHGNLQDTVTVIEGEFATNIDQLPLKMEAMFIDHLKHLYVEDLERALKRDVFAPGALVIADNLVYPGAPDYIKYMQQSSQFRTVFHDTQLEYSSDKDMVGVSVLL